MKQAKNILLILSIVLIIVIGIWIFQMMTGRMPFVDQLTRDVVGQLETSVLYQPFEFMTHLGSDFFLYPFVTISAILLIVWFKDWLPGLLFAGGTLLSHLFNLLIKEIVGRERPSISAAVNAEGHSFPSGHSMIPMVCYGLLAYFLIKKMNSEVSLFIVQFLAALLIFLIGISRFVLNVHYLTDIISGFFFGFLLLIALIYLYEWVQTKRSPSRG